MTAMATCEPMAMADTLNAVADSLPTDYDGTTDCGGGGDGEQRQPTRCDPEASSDSGANSIDFMALPNQLDTRYGQLDTDGSLRPTKIMTAPNWTLMSRAGLLSSAKRSVLREAEQKIEHTKAFDLIDALSRSGELPIEKVERSTLIMATTLHGTSATELLAPSSLARVQQYAPELFSAAEAARSPQSALKATGAADGAVTLPC